VSEASGDLLFLANPDIEFLAGSVSALVDAVAGGAQVVGPQLFWDSDCDVILPIPDDPHPVAELARTLRRRWPRPRHLERRISASWRVWTADEPCEVPSLRGPLMVLSRETFTRLGPLNDDYFLYYEETEWLWRARRRGAKLVLAPKAHVVHRWGHATRRCGNAGGIEERSRNLFFQRNYPAPLRAILRRLAPREEPFDDRFAVVAGPGTIPRIDADVWLVSIVSRMEPSVGCVRVGSLPPAIHELTSSGRWYAVAARRVNRRWRLQGRWTWQTS
jgi:GT2 family glycosyltransferase